VKKTVLVDAVEVVQEPEKVLLVYVPSVVRPQTLDRCLRVWMPTTDLVQLAPRSGSASIRTFAPEAMETVPAFPIFVPEDGEFRAMREVVGQWRRMRGSQGIGEVVETGAEETLHR
jgi:hypothetical protein